MVGWLAGERDADWRGAVRDSSVCESTDATWMGAHVGMEKRAGVAYVFKVGGFFN
jgi:hypothetical protein